MPQRSLMGAPPLAHSSTLAREWTRNGESPPNDTHEEEDAVLRSAAAAIAMANSNGRSGVRRSADVRPRFNSTAPNSREHTDDECPSHASASPVLTSLGGGGCGGSGSARHRQSPVNALIANMTYEEYNAQRVKYYEEHIRSVVNRVSAATRRRSSFIETCLENEKRDANLNFVLISVIGLLQAILAVCQQILYAASSGEDGVTPSHNYGTIVMAVMTVILSALLHYIGKQQRSCQNNIESFSNCRRLFGDIRAKIQTRLMELPGELSKSQMVQCAQELMEDLGTATQTATIAIEPTRYNPEWHTTSMEETTGDESLAFHIGMMNSQAVMEEEAAHQQQQAHQATTTTTTIEIQPPSLSSTSSTSPPPQFPSTDHDAYNYRRNDIYLNVPTGLSDRSLSRDDHGNISDWDEDTLPQGSNKKKRGRGKNKKKKKQAPIDPHVRVDVAEASAAAAPSLAIHQPLSVRIKDLKDRFSLSRQTFHHRHVHRDNGIELGTTTTNETMATSCSSSRVTI